MSEVIGVYVITLSEKEPGYYEALMIPQQENLDSERELWRGIGETPEWAMTEVVHAWCKWRAKTNPESESP